MTIIGVKSPALPARPAPVFWHAPTGRFRRTLRALNPLAPAGWTLVVIALGTGVFWGVAGPPLLHIARGLLAALTHGAAH